MAVWGEQTREQAEQEKRDIAERVRMREERERTAAARYAKTYAALVEYGKSKPAEQEYGIEDVFIRIECHDKVCDRKAYHTRAEYVHCLAGLGDTEANARAVWEHECDRYLQKTSRDEAEYKKRVMAYGIKAAHEKAGARLSDAGGTVKKPPKKRRQAVFNADPSVPEWAGGVINEAREEMEDHAVGRRRYEKAIMSGAYKGKESMYGHTLPGHGSSRKSCGMGHQRGCLNGVNHPSGKGKVVVCVHGCDQADCPKCFRRWVSKTAVGVVNRLRAFHKLYQSDPAISPGRLAKSGYVPFVVSWHEDMVVRMRDPVVYMEQMERATDMINKSGLRGAAIIEHPFRFRKKPHGPYFSCHMHGMGLGRTDKEKIQQLHKYGRLVDPMSEGEPRPLPVEERIVLRVFNGRVTHSVGYIFGHVAYLLTHAGLRRVPGKDKNAPVVRYVGDVSNRKAHMIEAEPNYAGSRSDLARKMEKIIGTRRRLLKIHKMVDENRVPFFPPRLAWRLNGIWAQSVASPGMFDENLDSGYGYGRPGRDGRASERLQQGSSLVARMGAAEARMAVWHGGLWTRAGFEAMIDVNAPKANSMRGTEGCREVDMGDDPNRGVDDPGLGEYEEHNTIVCKVVHEMDVEDAAVLLGDLSAWELGARMVRDQEALDAAWKDYRAESLAGGHAEMMDYRAYSKHYERYPLKKFRRPRLPVGLRVLGRILRLPWTVERHVVIDVDPNKKGLCAWCHNHYYPVMHVSGTYPAECSDVCDVEQEIDSGQWWRWDPRYVGDPRLPYLEVMEANRITELGVRRVVVCVRRFKAGHGAPVMYDEGIEVKPNEMDGYTERTRERITHMYRMSVARWAASQYSRVHKDDVPGVGERPHEGQWDDMREWRRKRRQIMSARRRRVQDVAYRYFVSTGAVDGVWDSADVLHTVDAEVERLGLGEIQ